MFHIRRSYSSWLRCFQFSLQTGCGGLEAALATLPGWFGGKFKGDGGVNLNAHYTCVVIHVLPSEKRDTVIVYVIFFDITHVLRNKRIYIFYLCDTRSNASPCHRLPQGIYIVSLYWGWLAVDGGHRHRQVHHAKGFLVVRGLVMCECVKVTFIQTFFSHR